MNLNIKNAPTTINEPVDPRHLSRILAVQYLFTTLKQAKANYPISVFEPEALLNALEETKYNIKLYLSIVNGVEGSQEQIDDLIKKYAPAWPIDQINPVDLVILRAAIWEGYLNAQTPVKVVINEAVEIAKALSSTQSAKFINGVLGSVFAKKAEELPTPAHSN